MEASQVKVSDAYAPHWTAWGEKTQRLVVTCDPTLENPRSYLLKLDQTTGAIAMDDAFRGSDGKAGFNLGDRDWSQGLKGTGVPHGAVFSR